MNEVEIIFTDKLTNKNFYESADMTDDEMDNFFLNLKRKFTLLYSIEGNKFRQFVYETDKSKFDVKVWVN